MICFTYNICIYRLEEKLHQLEVQHHIAKRWDEMSPEYKQQKIIRANEKKQMLLTKMSVCLRERWFLLSVKAKFAGKKHLYVIEYFYNGSWLDGHNMAARVSKSITAASVELKKYLSEYNNIPGVNSLTWKDVTDLFSPLWLFDSFNGTSERIPKSIKLASITNHHLILRADEEISLLKQEMSCVIKYHQNHLQKLYHLIEESSTATLYGAGTKCLLLFKTVTVEKYLIKCVDKFSSFITDDSCMVEYEKLISYKIGKLDSTLEDECDSVASDSDLEDALHAIQSDTFTSDTYECTHGYDEMDEFNDNNEDDYDDDEDDDDISYQNIDAFRNNHKGM